MLYKFASKAHINHMQNWYNEAVAKSSDGSEFTNNDAEESKAGKKGAAAAPSSSTTYGDDGYKYPQLDFPATHEDLASYNAGVKERIEGKYSSLIKNVHFYLSYLFLETGDYRSAVRHGETVLKNYEGRLTKKTEFTVR